MFKTAIKFLDFEYPKIMGIINLTSDSFFKDSRVENEMTLLSRVEKFILEGAEIIDIGAMSTRPGALLIEESIEFEKIHIALELITKNFPEILISVDTVRSSIATMSWDLGASIINDVSGGDFDCRMFEVISKFKIPYVLTHSRGNSQNMQTLTEYDNIIQDIVLSLSLKLKKLKELGSSEILIDPGFGFAKNLDQNYKILNNLEYFKVLNCPILIGLSRKSMIYKELGIEPEHALNGTSALHMFALLKGADIIRVHDVREAKQVIQLHQKLLNAN
jgi:dihydropteroate synthase